jgi:hypothetical protein
MLHIFSILQDTVFMQFAQSHIAVCHVHYAKILYTNHFLKVISASVYACASVYFQIRML